MVQEVNPGDGQESVLSSDAVHPSPPAGNAHTHVTSADDGVA